MAVTIFPLFEPVQIAAAATAYFTAQAPTRIDKLTCNNTDAVGHTVTIYWVPKSGASGPTNAIVTNRQLQPKESWDVSQIIGHVLSAGDEIAAVCDTAAVVTLFGSGTALTS